MCLSASQSGPVSSTLIVIKEVFGRMSDSRINQHLVDELGGVLCVCVCVFHFLSLSSKLRKSNNRSSSPIVQFNDLSNCKA